MPLQRTKTASDQLVGEILIVRKSGYYYEDLERNMPHIPILLKQRYPNLPCQSILKLKKYPLMFYAECQEIIDIFFAEHKVQQIFAREEKDFEFLKKIQIIHMTDQRLFSKCDYELKMQMEVRGSS
jgi:hypothetical protein